jgi:chromate transporter
MPSALILFAFAMGAAVFTGPVAEGFLHGLKLVAVAVVSQAVWGMTRTLTPDRARAGIALAAIAIVALFAGSFAQITAIAFGACAGLWLCQGNVAPVSGHLNFPVTRLGGAVALSLFAALLLLSPLLTAATGSHGPSPCSTRSTARARWCLAAAMSCCRYCKRTSLHPDG